MRLRRTLTVAMVSLWLGVGAGIASAQESGADADAAYQVAVSDEDVLVLEVMVDRYRASQGILAYRSGDAVFLPLGQLTGALEFPISVDPSSGTASGWVVDEQRVFELDVGQRRVQFGDRVEGLPDASLHLGYDDVYVRSDLLSHWFPADFEVDWPRMRVEVIARETLPLLARLERDRRRSALLGGGQQAPIYPERMAPYRAVSWPFLDLSIRNRGNDEAHARELTLLGRGDLAGMNAMGYVRSRQSSRDVTTGWLNFSRTDPTGELLGPLGATEITVGDVFPSSNPFVSSGRRGRGIEISNRERIRRRFDTTEVQGPAPPGWDAELYVDGRLRAIQTVGEDGRYLFPDVPVHAGRNVMRIVLYGPEGQEREEVQHFHAGPNAGGQGRLRYDAFVMQDQLSILGSDLWETTSTSRGELLHHVGLGYGFGRGFDASISFDRVPVGEGTSEIMALQTNKVLGGSLFRASIVDDFGAGHLLHLGAQGRVRGHHVLVELMDNADYAAASQQTSTHDDWIARARMRGTSRAGERWPVSYGASLEHRSVRGTNTTSISAAGAQASVGVGSLQLAHKIDAQRRTTRSFGPSTLISGNQLVSGHALGTRFRGTLSYVATEGLELRTIGLNAHRRLWSRVNAQVQVLRIHRVPDSVTSLDAQLNITRSDLVCGLGFGVQSDGGFRWGITLSTSLTVGPDARRWDLSGSPTTKTGAALVRAFVDHDGDDRFDDGDEPLEGVGFRRNLRWRDLTTDEEGEAWLTGIRADRQVNIEVDLASVFDPFLVPRHEGLTTIVHKGGIANLEFPFVYVGDIEGLVYRDLLRQQSFSGIGLELVDPTGERVATAVTEFDGYYVFQQIPAGAYKIRVLESTLPHGDFVVPPPKPVVVPERGDFVEGPDFILVREGERLDLKFAEDGTIEGDLPEEFLDELGSDEILARLRTLLARADDAPTLDELLSDPELSDQERRTLRILYEMFADPDQNYWLAR